MKGFTETILRDANQSLAATRMPLSDFENILDEINKAGYYSVECWGGATFDSCIRYLDEDPWERLRFIRKKLPDCKLQMLLRGQNLLGYVHYPTSMVRDFVQKSVENGIDIIRIFDALNDIDNIRDAVQATLDAGGHPSCAVSYTTSPVHTVEKFVELACRMEEIGAKSVCIKDMSGCLMPDTAYTLVSELKKKLSVPVVLHAHCSTGVAQMTYLKAIEAGVDVIDTAVSSFSGGTSQPATETMALTAKSMGIETGLDISAVNRINSHFKTVFSKMMDSGIIHHNSLLTDPNGLIYQVPGGMYSNLLSQLKMQGDMDRIEDVLEEVPRVRKDLGYPPLVTPLSQIVGTQAAMNVLNGERYSVVIKEVKAYLSGEYGKAPGYIDEEFRKNITGNSAAVSDMINYDEIKNEMTGKGYSVEDVLIQTMFPQLAPEFFRKRENKQKNIPGYTFKTHVDSKNISLSKIPDERTDSDLLAKLTAIIAFNTGISPEKIKIKNVYTEDYIG